MLHGLTADLSILLFFYVRVISGVFSWKREKKVVLLITKIAHKKIQLLALLFNTDHSETYIVVWQIFWRS